MEKIKFTAKSPRSQKVAQLLRGLQKQMASRLPVAPSEQEVKKDAILLNVSVNRAFSGGILNCVQREAERDFGNNFSSKTALSCILNPNHPLAPSLHFHASFTEFKNGDGQWRLIADINSAAAQPDLDAQFLKILKSIDQKSFKRGIRRGETQGNLRPKGELLLNVNFNSGNFSDDFNSVKKFSYLLLDAIISSILKVTELNPDVTLDDLRAQINFNTLRLYQFLAVDGATTDDLLVGEKEWAAAGLLPSHCCSSHLKSLADRASPSHRRLIADLVVAMGEPNRPGIRAIDYGSGRAEIIEAAKKHQQGLSKGRFA